MTGTGTVCHDDGAELFAAAQEVLAGEVGELARSHGGGIGVVEVRAGIVTVRPGGACHGCPASWFTLRPASGAPSAATPSRARSCPQRRLTGGPVRSAVRLPSGVRLTVPASPDAPVPLTSRIISARSGAQEHGAWSAAMQLRGCCRPRRPTWRRDLRRAGLRRPPLRAGRLTAPRHTRRGWWDAVVGYRRPLQ
ncbi:NifU family protein [Streptomyces sp. NPDC001920]